MSPFRPLYLSLPALLLALPLHAAIFINEIHYDDSTGAGDVGEGIEVVATGGEMLSDYDIVLYNGSNGQSYDTDALPVGSLVSCGGSVQIGSVMYATNGVQNGAPDGVALVRRSDSTVIQFLSYEGSMVASNGPANGMASTDIGVFETNSTVPGTSLQLSGGPGSVYADFTWTSGGSETFDGCNNGQTFGAGVDVPPSVASTTPADMAMNVAPNTNITITFSEPVTVGPGWFAINCSVSGPLGAFQSGGPTTFTLDPIVDFGEAETCTVSLSAAQIVDQDGTPDNMAADASFSFTIATDEPPMVDSTVPVNGASAVPLASNLTVNFNEPVSVMGSWYTLVCAVSGSHSGVVSGGPSSFVIDPDVDFDSLESCTLTILSAFVTDLDGMPDALPADVTVTFNTAAGLADYYASADPSTATTLRNSLHAIIDDHTRVPYTNGSPNTWAVLNMADEDPNDDTKILDVYRNASYTKMTGGVGAYNREHTWPNSLGFGNNDAEFVAMPDPALQNQPYSDTHMLYLSDTGYNSNRGNKYFGTCNASCTEDPTVFNNGQGGGSGTYPGNSNWYNGVLYEVWNARKGDMARAMFYMDIRFEGGTHGVTGATEPDLRLTDDPMLIQNTGGNAAVGYMGLLSTLLAWHAADPVTPAEVLRNEVIFSFQGNRNPFIDHPEWVACIYQDIGCGGGDPVLSVNDVSVTEGDVGTKLLTFTASLSAPAGVGGVSFVARTVDGTATEADSDYVGMSPTLLTINEGLDEQQMAIVINGDMVTESNEQFTLEIDTLSGATAGDLVGVGTILNDDGATPIAISINDPSQAEGDSGTSNLSFTVSLDAPAPVGGVSFNIATFAGTATAGSDFQAQMLTGQTIPEGQTTYTLLVPIVGDLVNESDEQFTVMIGNVTGHGGGSVDSSGTGTILNDDPLPRTIAELQGTGEASPFVDTVQVTLGNVVTAVGANLFAMQMPVGDGDAFTSDAVVVFTGGVPTVSVGDLVDVKGNLVEFFEFTEFTSSGGGLVVNVVGTSAQPAPIVLDDIMPSPVPGVPTCMGSGSTISSGAAIEVQNFECFEGMLVSTTTGLINAPHQIFGSDPIAEAFLTTGGVRVKREAGIDPAVASEPGLPPGVALWDGNPELFEIDVDRLGLPNDVLIPGTRISAVGVIGYDFGDYELWPRALTIDQAATLPVPAPMAGYNQISIASLNVENLFDTVDDPTVDDTVLTPAEFDLKLGKLSAYIREVMNSPDVVGLIEIENQTAMDALIARIAADEPGVNYQGSIFPGNDPRGINNAFIWRNVTVGQVTQLRLNQMTNECSGTAPCTLHDRPTLLLEGSYTTQAGAVQPFAVMVSHLRSLSGIDNQGALDNANRVRRKRLEQAVAVAEETQAFQSANPTVPLISLGDFNAFEFTDGYADVMGIVRGDANVAGDANPRDTLFEIQDIYPGISGNIVNPPMSEALENLPEDDQYSFLFGCGVNFTSVGCFAQALDHTILNNVAQGFYADFGYGRGNADARRDNEDVAGSPLRSSDHDGSVLILNFGDELLQDGFE